MTSTSFLTGKQNLLSIFFTAGFPQLNSTTEILLALQQAGADLVEVGMPYSDPLADGPVIQESSTKAIANGMTIELLLQQLKTIKEQVQIPVILMGYLNPVLHYGFQKFCKDAKDAGVKGLIIPDLPAYEYERHYQNIVAEYNLSFTFLITPQTAVERIKQLDALSSGFLYAVSSASTTGSKVSSQGLQLYLQKIQDLKLNNPVLTGFGIRNKETFDDVCRYTSGGVIGTAFIQHIQSSTDLNTDIKNFINRFK